MKVKVTQIIETMNEWTVEVEDIEHAEELALSLHPDRSLTEQTDFQMEVL